MDDDDNLNGGDTFYNLGRYEEALDAYNHVLSLHPDDPGAWTGKGFTHYMLRRYVEALYAFNKSLSLDQHSSVPWIGKGFTLFRLDRHKEALHAFDQASSTDPEDAHAWEGKGLILDHLGKYPEAVNAYTIALTINPDNASLWNNKAGTLCRLGNLRDALDAYNHALSLDPDNAVSWKGAGLVLCNLARYDDALAVYDKALSIDPQDPGSWDGKGLCLHNLGRYEEAIDAYDHALSIDLQNPEVWDRKGSSFYELGISQQAPGADTKALSINQDDPTEGNNKGAAPEKKGMIQKALDCYDKALSIDPGYSSAQRNKERVTDNFARNRDFFSRYWKGKDCYFSGDFERAEAEFKSALLLDPENADAWYLRGRSLILLLRFDEGIRCFENSLKIDRNNHEAIKFMDLAVEKKKFLRHRANGFSNPPVTKSRQGMRLSENEKSVLTCSESIDEGLNYRGDPEDSKQEKIIDWDFASLLRSDSGNHQVPKKGSQKDMGAAKKFFDDGFNYEFLGYHHEAIKAIDDGLKIFSHDENAWNTKGVALGRTGKILEAEKIFHKIISLHPEKVESMLNLCWILHQAEKYDDIQRVCDTILTIDPPNKNAKKIRQITTINASVKKQG